MREIALTKQLSNLTGIPETMLWTLHNRVSEVTRPDGVLQDARALEIYRSLDYDFERSFGRADPSHAVRSALFDAELRTFLAAHPDGVIVNLGEGLETQRFRFADNGALWLSVDVPEAMTVRERFIAPDEQHLHLAVSALDHAWFDSVPEGRAVYITAQGLLMYFEPAEVEALFRALAARFPDAWFTFDHIPRWLSRKTLKGWWKTPHYRTPVMPWGIDCDEVEPTLRSWVPTLGEVRRLEFVFPRGMARLLMALFSRLPWLNRHLYGVTRVRFEPIHD